MNNKTNNSKGGELTLSELLEGIGVLLNKGVGTNSDGNIDIKTLIDSLEELEDDESIILEDEDGEELEEVNESKFVKFSEVVQKVPAARIADSHGYPIDVVVIDASEGCEAGAIIREMIGKMKRPMIVVKEDGVVTKYALIENKYTTCPRVVTVDNVGYRVSWTTHNRAGVQLFFLENDYTKFILFDEESCTATIPMDIMNNEEKWKKYTNFVGKEVSDTACMLGKSNYEALSSKVEPNLETTSDIPEDFVDESEEKTLIATNYTPEVNEKEEEEEEEIDTNPDCFRCIAEYMIGENVDDIHFYRDENGYVHCDVQIKTIYEFDFENSDK